MTETMPQPPLIPPDPTGKQCRRCHEWLPKDTECPDCQAILLEVKVTVPITVTVHLPACRRADVRNVLADAEEFIINEILWAANTIWSGKHSGPSWLPANPEWHIMFGEEEVQYECDYFGGEDEVEIKL